MAKKDNTRPKNLDAKIAEKLDEAFDIAEEYFMTKDEAIPNFATDNLNREFIDALELMAKYNFDSEVWVPIDSKSDH